jgi:hypothetical protein
LTRDTAGFFAAWLVIIGGGQLMLFYVQLTLIRESLIDAKTAADAAKESADAAKQSADHLPRVERAYVFLASEIRHRRTPNAIPETGDILTVEFAFKNHGKTPAILTKIEAEVRTVDDLPTEIRRQAIEMPPGLIIGGGETTQWLRARNLVAADDWLRAARRERLILFVGAVEYRDVFGKPHATGFCLDWDGNGFSPSPSEALNYYA